MSDDPPMTAAERLMLDGHAEEIAGDLLRERRRQIEGEGFTLKHDEQHSPFALTMGAVAHVLAAADQMPGVVFAPGVLAAQGQGYWSAGGFRYADFKPKDRPRRALEIAGALIMAAIERLDREIVRDADQDAG